MKNFFAFFILLISYPVFAACPIDGPSEACVAEFNPVPTLNPIPANRIPNSFNRPFEGVADTTPLKKEIYPNSTRSFGPSGQDYNYNSSCQFGICRNTGTPTSITGEK